MARGRRAGRAARPPGGARCPRDGGTHGVGRGRPERVGRDDDVALGQAGGLAGRLETAGDGAEHPGRRYGCREDGGRRERCWSCWSAKGSPAADRPARPDWLVCARLALGRPRPSACIDDDKLLVDLASPFSSCPAPETSARPVCRTCGRPSRAPAGQECPPSSPSRAAPACPAPACRTSPKTPDARAARPPSSSSSSLDLKLPPRRPGSKGGAVGIADERRARGDTKGGWKEGVVRSLCAVRRVKGEGGGKCS